MFKRISYKTAATPWIKRQWVWLSRLPYSRGFGVQSPTDYRLVTEVILPARNIDALARRLEEWAASPNGEGKETTLIEGIHGNAEAAALWQRIVATEPHTLTFDLYYAGVVVTDVKRHKQQYIINYTHGWR